MQRHCLKKFKAKVKTESEIKAVSFYQEDQNKIKK